MPDDIQCAADLVRLPPTTKRELPAGAPDEVIARGLSPSDTVVESTSGTSGRVLRVHHSRAAYDRCAAFAFRHLRETGYRPWHRVAYTRYEPLPALPWEKTGLTGRQVACECRHHRDHVAADSVVCELVRDGRLVGPGEQGAILLTGLTNRAMPLLRYAIGDVGAASDERSPCGRGFPVTQLIERRLASELERGRTGKVRCIVSKVTA
jgi:phenylacetate-coenzyme A ligase PaaK-like adenylate-forming protein